MMRSLTPSIPASQSIATGLHDPRRAVLVTATRMALGEMRGTCAGWLSMLLDAWRADPCRDERLVARLEEELETALEAGL